MAVHRDRVRRKWIGVSAGCLFATAVLAGCEKNQGYQYQTADQAMQEQLKQYPQFHKVNVAKFAGTVSVDGKPPAGNARVFIILNDPEHFDETAHGKGPTRYTNCDQQGHFSFSTYERDDGAPVGKFVITFVQLHGRPGGRAGNPRHGPEQYYQPDELKNLYNDPNQNKNEAQFNVNVDSPGKTDYHFDLTVKGKTPVATPGPNALTGQLDKQKKQEKPTPPDDET
jgi:hypothetical protein